jgi:hypothetical protein
MDGEVNGLTPRAIARSFAGTPKERELENKLEDKCEV